VAIGPHPQGGQPHPCLPARGGPAAALGLALALPGRLRHVDPAPIDAHHRRRAGEAGGLEGRAPAFQTHADAVQGLQGEDLPSGPVQGLLQVPHTQPHAVAQPRLGEQRPPAPRSAGDGLPGARRVPTAECGDMPVGHRRVRRAPLAAVAATAGVRGCTPLGERGRTRAAQIRRQFLGSGLCKGPWPRGHHRMVPLLAHLRCDMVRETGPVHHGARGVKVALVMELLGMAHRDIPPGMR
jgi:hypothetical protein